MILQGIESWSSTNEMLSSLSQWKVKTDAASKRLSSNIALFNSIHNFWQVFLPVLKKRIPQHNVASAMFPHEVGRFKVVPQLFHHVNIEQSLWDFQNVDTVLVPNPASS